MIRVRTRSEMTPRRVARFCAAAVMLALCVSLAGGCAIGTLIGGMAESHRRQSTRKVDAKYTGLEGKSFAAVISADRMIQADFPDVVALLTVRIGERLAEHCNASGYVPGRSLLSYQYNNPRWVAYTPKQLADELGVERLILIDLNDFRLHDIGNQYLWDGVASGRVAVYEADGPIPDDPIFEEHIRVQFPDSEGLGPMQIPEQTVRAALSQRFIDRASWLFYRHDEPYYPDY